MKIVASTVGYLNTGSNRQPSHAVTGAAGGEFRHSRALPWALTCLWVLAGCRFLESNEKPATAGKPYNDPVLAQLLAPDQPVEHASLSVDARGYLAYEALFRESPRPTTWSTTCA